MSDDPLLDLISTFRNTLRDTPHDSNRWEGLCAATQSALLETEIASDARARYDVAYGNLLQALEALRAANSEVRQSAHRATIALLSLTMILEEG